MGKKNREPQKVHSMSESEAEENDEPTSPVRSPSPKISKKTKKKKLKPTIPLYSMEDFSDLQNLDDPIEFPTDLKVRHPLFGFDFEVRIGLKTRRKKKDRKHSKVTVKQELFSEAEGETPKKKRQREVEDSSDSAPKLKKIKQEICTPASESGSQPRNKEKKSRKSIAI